MLEIVSSDRFRLLHSRLSLKAGSGNFASLVTGMYTRMAASAITGAMLFIATSAAVADEATLAKRVEPHPSIDIDIVCAKSPRQCLARTERLLIQEPSESRRWFHTKPINLMPYFNYWM